MLIPTLTKQLKWHITNSYRHTFFFFFFLLLLLLLLLLVLVLVLLLHNFLLLSAGLYIGLGNVVNKSIYWYFFAAFLWVIFFTHIHRILLRWAVPQSVFFKISYWLGLLDILLMYLFVAFLIMPRAPTLTGMVVILKCHKNSFSISIFRFYIYLFYFTLSLSPSLSLSLSLWSVIFFWHWPISSESLTKLLAPLIFIFLSASIVKVQENRSSFSLQIGSRRSV